MNTGNSKHAVGRIWGVLAGFSIRARIAFSILLAFVMILPVVALSLFYFSDLISTIHTITERDVRLGRMGDDLIFVMRDVARIERGYRVFGDENERKAIEGLIARADSIVRDARHIAPDSEHAIVTEIEHALARYRNGFSLLVFYREENPPGVPGQASNAAMARRVDDLGTALAGIWGGLKGASPVQRDSLLTETGHHLELFSLDVAGGMDASGRNGRITSIQRGLDTARSDFFRSAQRLSEASWRKMFDDGEEALRIDARAKRNIIFVLILTAIISFVMIIRLPGYIVKPITGLSAMLRKTAAGELSVFAPVLSRDEIANLAVSYNQAVARLRGYDDLKTKKISAQKRSIDRLIDYLNVPVCIMSRNMAAVYYNAQFTRLFGTSLPPRPPENGVDLTKIPEIQGFLEQIRKKMAQVAGDFRFSIPAEDGAEIFFRGRPVRNTALAIETVIVIGENSAGDKSCGVSE